LHKGLRTFKVLKREQPNWCAPNKNGVSQENNYFEEALETLVCSEVDSLSGPQCRTDSVFQLEVGRFVHGSPSLLVQFCSCRFIER
jgi:hypothetical protein